MDPLQWLRKLRRPSPTSTSLFLSDLPDDILSQIFFSLMSPIPVASNHRIIETSYVAALPLAQTSTRFLTLFYRQLSDIELWQTGRLDNTGLTAIARNSNKTVRRAVLRKCPLISAPGLHALSIHCPNLRTLDISYVPITDSDLSVVIQRCSNSLRSLLIRGCVQLTDATLHCIGENCQVLEGLDMCGLPNVTDEGVTGLAVGLSHRLTMIVFSECPRLTDASLQSLGRWCPRLEVVTCRALSRITDIGLHCLCRGTGSSLAILDVLDCEQLGAKGFLHSVRRYCPQIARKYQNVEGRDLRQLIISSLSGFIFHVTGSDIHNGKAANYFLIVDAGTSNSFRVSIGSSSLDLTNYGCILASCFGDKPNEQVKRTLFDDYGLDLGPEGGDEQQEEIVTR